MDLDGGIWTEVASPPTLNTSNLRHEVLFSPTNARALYRLVHR
jgi:hypothetical protein